jgi:putative peptidoglycan lipid II flippase
MPRIEHTGRAAALISAGILASRVLGFVRQGVFSSSFGTSVAADAFNAAMRIPNILQNLFGEGVLSASFIPVYAGLLARDQRETADRVAAAVGGLLALAMAVLVAVGLVATPLLVSAVAIGFTGETRALTVQLVRIVFPGIGLLVMGAWCLGVLNSHRRFLLSYLAPVAMNVVLIATLLYFGRRAADARLATYLAWGAVAGALAQVLVQLPTVLRVAPGLLRRAMRCAATCAWWPATSRRCSSGAASCRSAATSTTRSRASWPRARSPCSPTRRRSTSSRAACSA